MTYRDYKRVPSDNTEINYLQDELEKIIVSISRRIDEANKDTTDLEDRVKKLEDS